MKYIFIVFFSFTLLFSNENRTNNTSLNFIYKDIKKIPKKRAALLLGTSKYLKGGGKNYFYTYRIEAVVALWKAKKIDAIVVSGDNSTKYYDETTTMYKDLIKAGIPKKYITKDHAGLRTLDSIVRARAIFDLDDYIIVSQEFHLKRALYIAHEKGQKAIGFAAKDIKNTPTAQKMETREFFAGIKAFFDLKVLMTEPKFYGEKVKVNYRK